MFSFRKRCLLGHEYMIVRRKKKLIRKCVRCGQKIRYGEKVPYSE